MTDTVTVIDSGKTIVVEIDGYSSIPGPPGPPGASGTGSVSADPGNRATLGSDSLIYVPPITSAFYIHTQAMLSDTWTVNHNMGTHPLVHAEDAAGSNIYGTVTHVSNDTMILTFAVTCTGKAYCS